MTKYKIYVLCLNETIIFFPVNGSLKLNMNCLLGHFFGRYQNNQAGQHDALSDAESVRDICLAGANKLGFENYLDYLTANQMEIIRQ